MDPRPNYLGGGWVGSNESIEVINPATGQVIGRVASAPREQVQNALKHSQNISAMWGKLPAKARADFLLAIASELTRRGEEIAKLVTQENGKPLSQSRAEVSMSIDHLRWFAEECRR